MFSLYFKRSSATLYLTFKMDGKFTCKSRFVDGGNTNDPLASLTYYSIFIKKVSEFTSLLMLSMILIYGHVILETHI